MNHVVDPAAFVDVLSPAIRQAASIARALEGRVANVPKQGEITAVKQALTVADTASQEALLVPLYEHFPQVALEAEEDTETARRFPQDGHQRVVVDPIDGTLHSYLLGEGPYAVMAGLASAGRFVAALIGLPREGLFFDAVRGQGAYVARAGSPRREARVQSGGARILVSHGMPEPVLAGLRTLGLDPVSSSGGAVAVAPLIPGVRAGLRWGTAAEGISIRGRIGVLIAREAGLCVRGVHGSAFPDDLRTRAPALLVTKCEADLELLDEALDRRVA